MPQGVMAQPRIGVRSGKSPTDTEEWANFFVLEIKRINRGEQPGKLLIGNKLQHALSVIKKLTA